MHGEVTGSSIGVFFGDICPALTPGFAWSVSLGGRRLAGGWGGSAVVDPETRPVQESTLFDLASLTKPLVTALLALQAQDRGEVDLKKSVPGSPDPDLTWLSLLRHEAGYPAWMPLYAFAEGRDAVRSWLLNECPRSRGAGAEYGCPAYVLLGLLLERILHRRLDVLFSERVVGPLGLLESEACFAPGPALRRGAAATERGPDQREDDMARQYGAVPPPLPPSSGAWGIANDGNARWLEGVSGNAGLFGTLKAVETLADAFRPGRGFLSPESLEMAWSSPRGRTGERRTAGWKAAESPTWCSGRALAPGGIGHEGYTGTGIWLEPREGRMFILLTNRIHPRHPGTDFGPVRARFIEAAKELT
jgi:CubicO group peptidase (beta-lactamase class C family)